MILFDWKLNTTTVEAPLHFGYAFSMCTGVETVKQSLNSIETSNRLFHSLNAHRHNANKYVLELKMKVKFKVNLALNW